MAEMWAQLCTTVGSPLDVTSSLCLWWTQLMCHACVLHRSSLHVGGVMFADSHFPAVLPRSASERHKGQEEEDVHAIPPSLQILSGNMYEGLMWCPYLHYLSSLRKGIKIAPVKPLHTVLLHLMLCGWHHPGQRFSRIEFFLVWKALNQTPACPVIRTQVPEQTGICPPPFTHTHTHIQQSLGFKIRYQATVEQVCREKTSCTLPDACIQTLTANELYWCALMTFFVPKSQQSLQAANNVFRFTMTVDNFFFF